MDTALVIPENIKRILRRKDILISLAIVGLGLLFSQRLYQEQEKKLKGLKNEIAQEEQRVKLGKEVLALENKLTQLSGPYFKKATSFAMNKFNDLASSSGVKIASISQEAESDSGPYAIMSYRLALKAGYHNLGKFISSLESLPDMLKLEELSVQGERASGKNPGPAEEKNPLVINMRVSLTFLKKE